MGNLAELRYLDVNGNQLTGPIPAQLGSLTNLIELNLAGNHLTGPIPPELGRLAKLRSLSLSLNQLSGCVPEKLREVQETDLFGLGLPFCDVLLSGISISAGEMTPIFDPYHTRYAASVGPPNFRLVLTNEHDSSINIRYGDRHRAEATGFVGALEHAIDVFSGATTIEIRVVSRDERAAHTYSIDINWTGAPGPSTITAVTPGGGFLNVSWTPPTEAGITAYDLRYVESGYDNRDKWHRWSYVAIDAWAAGSDGALAYSVTGLTAGTQYDVQVRAFIGVLPGPWSATATDTPTTPSVCVTRGAVGDPTSTGLISDCEALLAAGDELAGSAALSWSAGTPIAEWEGVTVSGTPGRVTRLHLRDRGLTGTMAPELGRLTGLERLYLHDNKLAGTIPDLGGLAKLERLWLNRNELSGTIPSGLGALSNLVQLNLHHNGLSGPIPTELSNLTSLEGLWLHANDLSGTIPPELGRLHNLKWLWLYGNQLSGGIPVELGYLYRLVELNLHSNQLTGAVPVGLGRLVNLEELWLQRNRLTGTIPPAFGRLSRLEWLSLYGNQLDGGIPTELGGLSMLKGLYLHHNRLSGEIPSALGELAVLTDLWLNDNEFSGPIPPELSNLAKLERVRMRDNAFTGCIPEGLAAVPDSDLDSLGLGVCDAS